MKTRIEIAALLVALALVIVALLVPATQTGAGALAQPGAQPRPRSAVVPTADVYLPLLPIDSTLAPSATATVTGTPTATATATATPLDPCATIPGTSYSAIRTEGGGDGRQASEHPDLNLEVRDWQQTDASLRLVDISGPTDSLAPRLYDLLPSAYGPESARFASAHRVYDWDWSRDERGDLISTWDVTLVGMHTDLGDVVRVPAAGYDIGTLTRLSRSSAGRVLPSADATQLTLAAAPSNRGESPAGFQVLVLYATQERITLKYTREDNVVSGYTIHVEEVCVEPSLLELYREKDQAGRQRLPALHAHEPFGRSRGDEILVAIRDNGSFMDPRSRKDWWR